MRRVCSDDGEQRQGYRPEPIAAKRRSFTCPSLRRSPAPTTSVAGCERYDRDAEVKGGEVEQHPGPARLQRDPLPRKNGS